MKIQEFTGGLATRLRPQFLNTNEGVEYNNIDSQVGVLAAVKAKTQQPDILLEFHEYFIAESQWVSKAVKTDFLEFNKKMYSTDRAQAQEVYDGTSTYRIGIAPPTIAPTGVPDISSGGALSGTLQYAISFYNSGDGVESALSPISAEVDMTVAGVVALTTLEVSTDPQVDKKRLYRIGGNLTAFTLVTTIDNTTVSHTDILGDLEVEGSLNTTAGDGPAPEGLSFLTEAYAMLFGAVGNKLVFTKIGEPWNWPALNFLVYGADITGIATTANGLLIFTAFKTHLVTGTGPTALSTQQLSSNQGCKAFESVANISSSALWASTDGICVSDGSTVTLLSKAKLGKLALTPVSAEIHDEVYYLVNSDKTILAFDYGVGKVFKTFSLGVSSLHVANDILYGWHAGVLHSMFSAVVSESMSYLSPRFIEGRVSELKTYKKVYIYSVGDIIIDIIIDNKIVSTTELTGTTGHIVQVPQSKQRGYFIQFNVTGVGEVHEIEYTVGNRANG